MSLRAVATVVLTILVLTTITFAQDEAAKLLAAGDKFAQQNKNDEALKSFEKANSLRGDRCSACQLKIAYVRLHANEGSAALKAANKALSVATTPAERVDANAARGEIMLGLAGNDKKKIAEAEDAFRAAINEDKSVAYFHQRLGICLLKQNKFDEGKSELQRYLAMAPNAPNAETVKAWIADPRRVGMALPPNVSFVDLKGDKVSFADFKGKVVLVDFWTFADWCWACQEQMVRDKVILKQLVKQYPADKLVVISILQPTGNDEVTWREHVKNKNMNWIHYRDGDFHVINAWVPKVTTWPMYVLIDKDGFIRDLVPGGDQTQALTLSGRIKKLLE